jgi:soluble cytochrome b562
VAVPIITFGVLFGKSWIIKTLDAYLTNGDTPIAVYQHQTRDKLEGVSEDIKEIRADVKETTRLLIGHIDRVNDAEVRAVRANKDAVTANVSAVSWREDHEKKPNDKW